MLRFILVAVCVGTTTVPSSAQEAVTIKPPVAAKAGEKLRVTDVEKSKTVMDFVIGGEKMLKVEEDSRSVVYVQEVVTAAGKGDAKPLKLTRTYEKFDATEQGKPVSGPPLDVAIVIEKKKDTYTFAAGDKKLDAGFLKKLDGEFNAPDTGKNFPDFLPTKPVKTGDTWKLPAKRLFLNREADDDGPKLDTDKLVSGGRVLKVYRKGGERFVVLEMSFAAPMLTLGKDAPKITEASMSAKLTIDFCPDRTTPASTTVSFTKMSAKLNDPFVSGLFSFEQSTNSTEELLNK